MPATLPTTIHGLRVLTPRQAHSEGFVSITTDIHSLNEEKILAGVCQHRNPERACLIQQPEKHTYQLAIAREDVSDIAE